LLAGAGHTALVRCARAAFRAHAEPNRTAAASTNTAASAAATALTAPAGTALHFSFSHWSCSIASWHNLPRFLEWVTLISTGHPSFMRRSVGLHRLV